METVSMETVSMETASMETATTEDFRFLLLLAYFLLSLTKPQHIFN